jgi:diguanylate cyclase (GGDEF)-like protein
VLRQTFRNSDIFSRIGADEFAILAQNVQHDEMDHIIARLEENLRANDEQSKHGYQLSLSIGAVWIVHDSDLSIEQLVDMADKSMYDHKRSKKQWSTSLVHAGFRPNQDASPTAGRSRLSRHSV